MSPGWDKRLGHLAKLHWFSIEGVTSEDLNDFEEMLIEEATDCGAQSFRRSGVGESRRQCLSKGKSDDSLKLASRLVHVFEEDKCDFFRGDRESFEWKFLRDDDHRLSHDEKKTVGECGRIWLRGYPRSRTSP